MASIQSVVSPVAQPTGPKSVSRPKRWSEEVEEGIILLNEFIIIIRVMSRNVLNNNIIRCMLIKKRPFVFLLNFTITGKKYG